MSTLRHYLSKFDQITDTIKEALTDRDNRWVLLIGVFVFMMLLRALGAAGLSDLVGLFYIMYFVTFWRNK